MEKGSGDRRWMELVQTRVRAVLKLRIGLDIVSLNALP
jgi:hypothetical protein